jgi:hypothetical protein
MYISCVQSRPFLKCLSIPIAFTFLLEPKLGWVGLEDSTATYESPNQLCSTYPSSAKKGYNYRKKGLDTKFIKKKDDLTLFHKQLLKHLIDCGMDSIAYIEDPTNSSIMSNVIKEYGRFTLSIELREGCLIKPTSTTRSRVEKMIHAAITSNYHTVQQSY